MKTSIVIAGGAAVLIALAQISPAVGANTDGEAAVANAEAETVMSPHFLGNGRHLRRVMRELSLTEEQRNAIRGIVQHSTEEGQKYAQTLRAAHRELQASIETNGFYEDQVRIAAQSQVDTIVELIVLRTKTMADVREVLTPEQRVQLDELTAEWGSELGHPRKHRRE